MVLGLVYLPDSVLVLAVRVAVVLYAGIDPVAEIVAAIASVVAVVVAAAPVVADRKLAKPPVVVC